MDNLKILKEIDIPEFGLDTSYTANLTDSLNAEIEGYSRNKMEMAEAASESRKEEQKAIKETADNTTEINNKLQRIIDQQADYIDLLKRQLTIQGEQLDILKEIFSADADSAAVEQEIEKILQEQIDSHHPMMDLIKDKAGDMVAEGIITSGIPILYNTFKLFLQSKGILLP